MLSNETPPNTTEIERHLFDLARIKIGQLGSQLIRGERNPTPSAYELPNPNRGVYIRKLVQIRPHVDKACQDHNALVASLGHVEQWEHLWKGKF